MGTSLRERKKIASTAEHITDPTFPKEIFLDLTSYCNQVCIFCSNSRLKNKSTMKPELVERVLLEAYKNGTRDIGMYATGESFMVKNLADYIARAKEIGYEYIFITTNGALAVPTVAKSVLDAGLDSIKFSISAGTRETYKIIHGRDDFDKVMRNLKWVSEYRKKSELNYRIYVTMVYTNVTKNEIKVLKDLVSPHIDEWDPHLLTNQCGNKYDNNELGDIKEENIRGRLKSKICFQPFKGFTVTPEGFISACVLDYQRYLIVGDLKNYSLKEIWMNDKYLDFRRRHIEGKIKGLICYNCINNSNEDVVPLMPESVAVFDQ